MQRIPVPNRLTKSGLAHLLMNYNAEKYYGNPDSYKRWLAKHFTVDQLMLKVKQHNMSIDKDGNSIDPHRYDLQLIRYIERVAEFLNLTEDEYKLFTGMLHLHGVRLRTGACLDDVELRVAIYQTKSLTRSGIAGIREMVGSKPKAFDYPQHGGDPMYKIIQRFHGFESEYFETVDKLEALEIVKEDIEKEFGAKKLKRLEQTYIKHCDKLLEKINLLFRAQVQPRIVCYVVANTLPIATELPREDRTAIQRAIKAGILERQDGKYVKAGSDPNPY